MHPTLQNALLNSTLRVVSGVANTTQNLLTNVIKKQNGTDKGGTDYGDKGHPFLSQKRRFMLMIGGWLMTGIFLFGVVFMVVTHFLGRRQWRKYQERLVAERNVNHIFVDPKFMKYTQKGWKEIVHNM